MSVLSLAQSASEEAHILQPPRLVGNSDIVLVGASAGGVEALKQFVHALDGAPVTVFVVLHLAPTNESVLPTILQRASARPCKHAEDFEPIVPGLVYVAPPDRHLTIHEGSLRCLRGPRINGCRPAVDPLSGARHWCTAAGWSAWCCRARSTTAPKGSLP